VLDPEWTPEAGYAHAANLLAIIKRQEEEESNEASGTSDQVADDGRLV
jgi:hypothetical protein